MAQHIGTLHTARPKNAQSWLRVTQHEETLRPASVHSAMDMGIHILKNGGTSCMNILSVEKSSVTVAGLQLFHISRANIFLLGLLIRETVNTPRSKLHPFQPPVRFVMPQNFLDLYTTYYMYRYTMIV